MSQSKSQSQSPSQRRRRSRDLRRLLTPQTLAVVGGLEAERVIEQCDKLGFEGTIWPVNPKRESMGGRPCFASVGNLPGVPDAAYIAVNCVQTIETVGALSQMGCGGAVCYAAGFAEAEGGDTSEASLQGRLVAAAGEMPFIGPNCYGFINTRAKVALWPDQHGAVTCQRGVAIVTQSSNIAISMTMQSRGLPIAYAMTAGNQAQTGLSTLATALLHDEHVTALGIHIEGLDNVRAFEQLALAARTLGKPVVALKVGESEYAQRAALTHTASLAGSAAAFEALASRLGIATVQSIEAFLETLKLFHSVGPLGGRRVLSLSCSGGEAALMADALARAKLSTPPFEARDKARLQDHLGDVVTVSNPFDYNTFIWGEWDRMRQLFQLATQPHFDLAMLVLDFPREDRCDLTDWHCALDAFLAGTQANTTPASIVATMPENLPEAVAQRLTNAGVAALTGIDNATMAAAAGARVGESWKRPCSLPVTGPRQGNAGSTRTMDEHAAKQLLASRGVPVPPGQVLSSEQLRRSGDDSAVKAQWPGPGPYALKMLDVAHKSEIGGVVLGLESPMAVVRALAQMNSPHGRFLVEEMIAGPVIAELIVGVTHDPVIGPTLTIGAGGVLTELLEDAITLILPVRKEEIGEALSHLRIIRLLDGYRGGPAANMPLLIDTISQIAAVALHEPVVELDVNPLMVTPTQCVAADALIVLDVTVR
jgi:acyl-CoA synthetase (NDP forming)